MIKSRIERIRKMESTMDRVAAAFRSSAPLTPEIKEDLKALEKYYQTEWLGDFEADEKGLLPPDLKRGILSEDALYNLLADADKHK